MDIISCIFLMGIVLADLSVHTPGKKGRFVYGHSTFRDHVFNHAIIQEFKLQTRITAEGVYYRFFPLERRFREIKKSDIEKLEVKSYDPLRDYGGWGIKYGINGWADSVKGDKGIYISLTSRKHILIGTSKPDEAAEFLISRGYNVR